MFNATFPHILALDFDGVLCDGRGEYLESSWRVYSEIWGSSDLDLETLRPRFYALRSVIETGWEMPLLLRSMQQGVSDLEIEENWSSLVPKMLEREGLTSSEIAQLLDEKRDRWLETHLEDWLAHHQFYPHVLPTLKKRLESTATKIYIITTKEGRFARKLLEKNGINFPSDQIIGKEYQQPKTQTLLSLMKTETTVWFVEDRLKTLLSVQKFSGLEAVGLFLADWGYNTARSRAIASKNQGIKLLSLEQFNQDFSLW